MISQFFKDLGIPKRQLLLTAGALLGWIAAIIASGAGWNPFPTTWNFANTGAFGDSFGPLSALMASLAALGAIATYRAQAHEIRRVKRRDELADKALMEDRQRAISREFLSDENSARQSFESTFFQLLNTLQSVVRNLDVGIFDGQVDSGQDAFRALLRKFKTRVANPRADIRPDWLKFSEDYKNDLNHYFRITYHIVKYVKSSSISNSYFYIQILRAMLSDSELSLLALNCEYGHGRDKFKDLIEEFALLHNLSQAEKDYWNLTNIYEPSAFDYIAKENEFEFIEAEDDVEEVRTSAAPPTS